MFASRFPRRRFLQGVLAAGVLRRAPSWAQSPAVHPVSVLLGTQTGAGIYRARWDASSGVLSSPELAIATPRPTFLALHPTLPVLYAGNEGDGPAATVSAFSLDRRAASLALLGSQPTQGNSPCFVSVDRTGQLLFAANYGGGSLAAFPLSAGGVPDGAAAQYFSCAKTGLCGTPGPVHDRQDGPHLHCATLSPDNRFVLACDLGDDAILAFPIHPGTTPALGIPQRLPARIGSGPRHLAFHPNGRWLYCIHEIDCTVDLYTWNSSKGVADAQLVAQSMVQLAGRSTTSTPNTAAEIAISRNGQFLYACTRGIDILTVFHIDPATGSLTQLQQLSCGGQSPRFFALDPTEQWLLCTNQVGNSVTIFARNTETGQLTPHGSMAMPSPMCVVWL